MKATHTVLNGLIEACRDDVHAQSSAAKVVSGAERRARLQESARRREVFVQELSTLIRAQGKTPHDGGSLGETLRGAFRSARALVIGDNTGDAYSWVERVEGKTEDRYESALAGTLPTETRAALVRQHAEISGDRAELRILRSGGQPS